MKTLTLEHKATLDTLTNTKAKVTFLTDNGYSVGDISGILHISESAVSHHRRTKDAQPQVQRERGEIDEKYFRALSCGQKVGYLTGLGYSVRDISALLSVSEGTVSYHRKNKTVVPSKEDIFEGLLAALRESEAKAEAVREQLAMLN